MSESVSAVVRLEVEEPPIQVHTICEYYGEGSYVSKHADTLIFC